MKIIYRKDKKFSLNSSGVTLMETLVGIGVVVILTMSIYLSLTGAVRNMGDAKQRSGAVALANERMEILRHLPYEEVGTLSGIGPQGPIPNEEVVKKNGFNYTVRTEIRYVDDLFDGSGGDDPINTDYKQARVRVFWTNGGQLKYTEFFSNFIPNGVETNVGGGTLSINTTTSAGEIVSNVSVHIESVDDDPAVDVTAETDSSGSLVFPGAPAQSYRITLSKSGYETVRTYPNPPGSDFVPINSDILVNEGSLNMKTFALDQGANLTIKATNVADDSGIEEISFSLQGGKLIGTDPDTYSLDETTETNSSGEITKTSISPGVYNILNLAELGNSDYSFIGADSILPIDLAPNQDQTVSFLFARKTLDSLVVRIHDSTGTIPVVGAQVHLTGPGGFDQTIESSVEGIAYFPPVNDPVINMEKGEYQLTITADGFDEYSDSVNNDDLVVKDVNMTEAD